MEMMDRLAYHLAQVWWGAGVGGWRGRRRSGRTGGLRAGRGRTARRRRCRRPRGARPCAHQGGHPGTRASEAVSRGGGQRAL